MSRRQNGRAWSTLVAASVTGLATGSFGCSAAAHPVVPTAKADASGVTVTVRLVTEAGGARQVQATFAPDKPGFHIYSVDMPDGGLQGLGIPTRLRVQGGLSAGGVPVANQTVVSLAVTGTDLTLPVYPDGPVTLTLPVVETGPGHADVVVTYGACSPGACLTPVRDERIPLDFS